MTLMEVFLAEERGQKRITMNHQEPKGKNPLVNLLTPPEVAALKNTSVSAVTRAIYEGRLPAWRKGPLWLVPRQEAEKWQPVKGRGRRVKEADV